MSTRRAGFTLIELLVVVALVAIMLVIAVPSFTSFISNYRVTSAVNDFLQGVTLTRNEALKRGRRVMMMPNVYSSGPPERYTPSPTGDWRNGWTIYVHVGTSPPLYDAATDTIIFQHLLLDASISVANAGGGAAPPFTDSSSQTYISFDGTGYPRQVSGGALTGGIVFTDTTGSSVNTRTLCLANLGRPRIVKDVPETCAGG